MNNSENLNLDDAAGCSIERNRKPFPTKLKPEGKFTIEHIRNGEVIHTEILDNTAVNEGRNKMLDTMFNNSTPITTWYIGLMDNASYSTNPVTDTMSSHAGWIEFTGYSESVRQTWGTGAAASQQVTNATAATFTINATGILRGIFVASNSTKSGTTGTLWATALFASTVAVASTDQIKITYTVQI